MKRLWLVRLGKHGEQEPRALETSELVLGFHTEDLSSAKDRQAILALAKKSWPDFKPKSQLNFAAQLNQFCNMMQIGDLVIVPFKTTGQIGIAEVIGPYIHTPDGAVSRKIKWLKPNVPRETFRRDLLYSFGAFMTVCEIGRNDALRRVEFVVKTGQDPGYESFEKPTKAEIGESTEGEDEFDLVQIARDQIERRIASAFAGHEFTRLIAEILKAQGYRANVSPPGPDNGIDIVAGQGALGFDPPKLVVQVKSGNVVADQPTLQALIGEVQDAHADHGLLVCWGGFKRTVDLRRNELFFRIRLWGRTEIMDALLDVYDRLPEEFRAELPLKRIWTLVPAEEQPIP